MFGVALYDAVVVVLRVGDAAAVPMAGRRTVDAVAICVVRSAKGCSVDMGVGAPFCVCGCVFVAEQV